jgi:hypothetical protein
LGREVEEMAEGRDEADRFAAGTGNTDAPRAEDDDMRPGVTAGGATYLPETGRAAAGGADRTEGTIGAVGEMDITGAPAGPGGAGGPSGGTGAGETRGGGTGGGSMATGGAGPSPADAGPQSGESTAAFLGDRELSTAVPASGTGGAVGAGGEGGAGGSDAAGGGDRE